MKKFILISAVATVALFADMASVATDAVSSQVKNEVKTQVVEKVAGGDAMKKEVANKVADEAMASDLSVDKLKKDATDKLTQEAKEQATDMAAEEAEKAVGKETLTKETAKSAIKSVL